MNNVPVTWRQLTINDPNVDPVPRVYQGLATVPGDRIYMSSGYRPDLSQYINDLFTFDGVSTWTQLNPSPALPGPQGVGPEYFVMYGMAWDFRNSKLVAVGHVANILGPLRFGTFTYDGFGWTEIITATSPPLAHGNFAVVYDQGSNTTLIFGGNNSGVYTNQTWVFNGARWAQAFPAHNPVARDYPPIGWHPIRRRVVVLDFNGDTWEWDGIDWAKIVTAGVGTPDPTLAYTNMAWCGFLGALVLFGGQLDPTFVSQGQTWAYDGGWTQLAPPVSPPARETPQLVTPSADGVGVTAFGGEDITFFFNDTWVLESGSGTITDNPSINVVFDLSAV